MLRSKDVRDYFEAKLSDIRPEMAVSFDINLYFSKNSHLLMWREKGETISADLLAKYSSRGMRRIWIHRSEALAFHQYVTAALAPGKPAPKRDSFPRTIEGSKVVAIKNFPTTVTGPALDLEEKKRQAYIAKTSRDVLAAVTAVVDGAMEIDLAKRRAREFVRDLLDDALEDSNHLINNIWALTDLEPDLNHAVTVATYAVIFALAFGRIGDDVIVDLAVAGLIHDIGVTQIPFATTTMVMSQRTPEMNEQYKKHVNAGISLVESYAKEVTPRVRVLISQHHEKFNGTGYPVGLKNFAIDDLAQLLGIADLVDVLSCGEWDGNERSLLDTFRTLETMEKARNFPEHFNPDVLGAVVKWATSGAAAAKISEAAEIVNQGTQNLLKKSTA